MLQVLAGHSAEVTSLHLCQTGRYILSSSTDGTCHLWDLHSQVVDLPVPHRGGIRVCPPPPAELPVCLRCSLSASHGAVCSHRITSRTRVIALRAGTAGADVRDPA